MSPKMIDREKKAKDIAGAALTLFSQKGYSATSVDRIAEAAGIGKGTVYDYFDTKEEIFIAAIMGWLKQVELMISSNLDGLEDPVQRLQAIVDITLEMYDQFYPTTIQIFLQFVQQSMMENGVISKRRYLLKDLASGIRKTVINVLLDGISKGVFRPEIARDAEKIAINLHAYLDGIGLHSIISDNNFALKSQIEFYFQNLIQTIAIDTEAAGAMAAS